jgi:transposase
LSCQHGHCLEVLLPHLAGVVVERAEVAGTLLCIRARAGGDIAVCPGCGRGSRRVHSGYERRLADAAVGGRRVVIRLQVRRLFCDEPGCKKRTFAEQVPGLTVRYGRKTPLLAGMLQAIAVALAGRAACRLARALHAAASRSTLLRLVMAAPDPPAPAPRVVGVDDFALRRGQTSHLVVPRMRRIRPAVQQHDQRPAATLQVSEPQPVGRDPAFPQQTRHEPIICRRPRPGHPGHHQM